MPLQKLYNFRNFLLFGILLTLVRIFYIYWLPYDLYPDEAQYWTWSKDLAFGYYSKPPLIAWIISLSTNLCGDNQLCVKLPSPIIYLLTSVVIYFIAIEISSKKVGFLSALVFLTIPGVTVASYLITTDAPLLLFWAISLLFFIKATKSDSIKWWCFAGIFAGLGMLSKYSTIVFLLSSIFYLTTTSPHKFKLKGFWIAIFFAFLILVPNIIWNFQNNFVSYLHTEDNLKGEGNYFNIMELINFILMQIGVFGPILFFVLIYLLLFKFKRFCLNKTRILTYFAVPFLIIVLTVSFFSRAHGNWGAPLYIAATIMVVMYLAEIKQEKLISLSILLHLCLAGVFYNFDKISADTEIKFRNPFDRITGWHHLAREVDNINSKYKVEAILTDERKTISSLMYYLRDENGKPGNVLKIRNNNKISDHYDLTRALEKATRGNFLYVTKNTEDLSKVTRNFREAKRIKRIVVKRNKETERFIIYYLSDFRGYK